MTNYTLRKASPATTRTDAVVVAVGHDAQNRPVIAPGGEAVAGAYGRAFRALLAAREFTGKHGEVLRFPTTGRIRAGDLVIVGVGDVEAITALDVQYAAGTAARQLNGVSSVALALPTRNAEEVAAAISGFISGGYRFTKIGHQDAAGLAEVIVLCEGARRADIIAAFEHALVIEDATRQARDWINTPPNLLTPAIFAEAGAAYVAQAQVDAEVLKPAALRKLGCGGILGVGGASTNEPRMLRMRWAHPDAYVRIVLVGKGITYDSGGLTIKPASSMPTMKYDMAGAAAVIAATQAIATLGLKVDLRAYAPMAENAVSGSAMRPGDVITMPNGRTVEISNADAEGRLILADALCLAVDDDPAFILEISTLTGACVTALGDRVAGLFGEDDVVAMVETGAAKAREAVWRLPIPESTSRKIRSASPVADVLQHDWVRWGSASYAAGFIAEFAGDVDFAHLDIAGPAWNAGGARDDQPRGATGFGVRTLVESVAHAVNTL